MFTACHTLDLSEFVHLSEQCRAHIALEAVNFLTDNFTKYRLILNILSMQTQP